MCLSLDVKTFSDNRLRLRNLSILRFDRRAKSSGVDPDFSRVPVFSQLVRAPRRFRADFAQLPRRMRANLRRILAQHAGEDFDMEALCGDLIHEEEVEFEAVVTTMGPVFPGASAGVTTTPSPRLPPSFGTTSVPDLIGATFSEVFPTSFPTTTATTGKGNKFRLRLPTPPMTKLRLPPVAVEEVTFERVSTRPHAAAVNHRERKKQGRGAIFFLLKSGL